MKWRDIKTHKPQDGQRVLMYCSELAALDKRDGDEMSPGVHIGTYVAPLDLLRPLGTHGFSAEFWMPLPNTAPAGNGHSKRKVAV